MSEGCASFEGGYLSTGSSKTANCAIVLNRKAAIPGNEQTQKMYMNL
jgi:hypothetical protein